MMTIITPLELVQFTLDPSSMEDHVGKSEERATGERFCENAGNVILALHFHSIAIFGRCELCSFLSMLCFKDVRIQEIIQSCFKERKIWFAMTRIIFEGEHEFIRAEHKPRSQECPFVRDPSSFSAMHSQSKNRRVEVLL